MDLKKIKSLVNRTVERIFLIVFPPIGEESILEIDIRLGLVLKGSPEKLVTISTDMNDLWTPVLHIEPIPPFHYSEFHFEKRIEQWMKEELKDEIILEHYEVTNSDYFRNIVGKKIEEIQILSVYGNPEPFGLKFLFENDFIISFPNSDGNTIETKKFNKNENMENFKSFGEVIYSKV